MDGACAALSDAAAEFRSGQAEFVAHHPEQRRFGLDVELVFGSVDGQVDHVSIPGIGG